MSEQIKKIKTGKKDGQLLIRIQSTERDEFIRLCEELDTSAARELRKFIRGFVKQHKPNEQPYQGVIPWLSKLNL